MKVDDLTHDALFAFDRVSGMLSFAKQRALLFDAVGTGLLRKYLVESFGLTASRTLLTQFGFAHGWRMAESLADSFTWDSDEDWRQAGTRIHALQGLYRVEPGEGDPLTETGSVLTRSFEAEQHHLYFGRAEVAVCWTICGLTSGYLSRTTGDEIFVLEEACLGKGDAHCRLVGRTRAGWGHERAEDLRFFESDRLAETLDVSPIRVMESLKAADRELGAQRRLLARVSPEVEESPGLVTTSASMRRLVELARRVAQVDTSALLTGEAGTDKERLARMIHDASSRSDGPFVRVDCSAIPKALLESELFGHSIAAFAGATQDRPGLFEAAHRGTLLLKAVGVLPPNLQARVLKLLEEGESQRMGETRQRPVDVRVLAATDRDLTASDELPFRQDLYYRLRIVELYVPSLRERRDDILPLARTMLVSSSLRLQRAVPTFSNAAADQLLRYHWPGNVRELENVVERALALGRTGQVEIEDLPREVRTGPPAPVPSAETVRSLREMERDYILEVLARNDGNRTQTAEQLQIGTATLYRKLKRFAQEASSP